MIDQIKRLKDINSELYELVEPYDILYVNIKGIKYGINLYKELTTYLDDDWICFGDLDMCEQFIELFFKNDTDTLKLIFWEQDAENEEYIKFEKYYALIDDRLVEHHYEEN